MLLRVLSSLLLIGCSAATVPCPSPVPRGETATGAAVARSSRGSSDEERVALPIAEACVRGEMAACRAIARVATVTPTDAEQRQAPAPVALAAGERPTIAEQEAAIGEKLLEAAGPERLDAPRHLEAACDLKHGAACNSLGWAWSTGFGALRADKKKAAELYELACDLENRLGCVNRGHMARSTNKAKAAEFMHKACELELEDACVALAGTVAEAEAACRKSPADCVNWGVIQERGYGVPVDRKKAFSSFQAACAAKDAVGCFDVGIFLRDGKNGTVDVRAAKRHFAAACKGGYDGGCRQAALLSP